MNNPAEAYYKLRSKDNPDVLEEVRSAFQIYLESCTGETKRKDWITFRQEFVQNTYREAIDRSPELAKEVEEFRVKYKEERQSGDKTIPGTGNSAVEEERNRLAIAYERQRYVTLTKIHCI